MANNRKYYWLKLKEDFFEEKQVKYLRGLPDGEKLIIAYLKMQLKSLKTEGFLKYDQILPSSEEELAIALDEDVNIIKLLIGALIQVKAIEKLDDGSFYMIAMQKLIGKEGESAERVRNFREREKKKMLQSNDNVTKCNTEIDKEIDIELEKDINNIQSSEKFSSDFVKANDIIALKEELQNVSNNTVKASKHKYGEYKNVLLKDEELQELKEKYQNWEELIRYLDEYIEMKGYKAKSHYLCIKKWVIDAVKKENNKSDIKNINKNTNWLMEELKNET